MRRARGFGLIEVLVTLLVFSIGALAVAGLQAVSKKNRYNALQRSTAVRLAHSMAARMHANPQALSDYLVATDSPLGGDTLGGTPASNCYNTCTPKQLAKFDLWQWEQMLDGASETSSNTTAINGQSTTATTSVGGLVAPSACITTQAGSHVYQITIVWRGVTLADPKASVNCGNTRADWYKPPSGGSNGSLSSPSGQATGYTETYKRSFTLTTYIQP